jgi:hypothetical protein
VTTLQELALYIGAFAETSVSPKPALRKRPQKTKFLLY